MTVIIYPPTINWDWMTQRPQQLMKQFANDSYQIYFCNKTQSSKKVVTKLSSNINIIHNNKSFIRYIIPKIKKNDEIIIWYTWPKLNPYIRQYFPDKIIFDYIDDFPAWSKYVNPAIDSADLVITSAINLKQELEQKHPNKPSFLIPNGCDIQHFQQYTKIQPKKPLELQNHKGPVLTYIGAWASWIDEELVEKISLEIPEALILIIGCEFGKKFNLKRKNILYIGYKPYKLLPQYLYYSDVSLIPFKINQITKSTNPIKMYEYLAAGKPVVSTNIPEAKNKPYVYIGRDYNSYIQQIKTLLSPSFQLDSKKLNVWLKNQSWEKRYIDIKNILSR